MKRTMKRYPRSWISQASHMNYANNANNAKIAKIVGNVFYINAPVFAPFTRRHCCCYDVAVKERRRDSEGSRHWSTIVSESHVDDFLVGDGTGIVRVPARSESRVFKLYDADSKETAGSFFGNQATDAQKEFMARHGRSVSNGLFGRRYMFSEGIIEQGEQVAVIGVLRPDPYSPPGQNWLVVCPPEGPLAKELKTIVYTDLKECFGPPPSVPSGMNAPAPQLRHYPMQPSVMVQADANAPPMYVPAEGKWDPANQYVPVVGAYQPPAAAAHHPNNNNNNHHPYDNPFNNPYDQGGEEEGANYYDNNNYNNYGDYQPVTQLQAEAPSAPMLNNHNVPQHGLQHHPPPNTTY